GRPHAVVAGAPLDRRARHAAVVPVDAGVVRDREGPLLVERGPERFGRRPAVADEVLAFRVPIIDVVVPPRPDQRVFEGEQGDEAPGLVVAPDSLAGPPPLARQRPLAVVVADLPHVVERLAPDV